ncbi:hypothetical protein MKEN_00400800 [Mycena kentingensis (nom. inval.)]|nr:hypothetical protein MKEN_00400800 [Mycena kentingensis (nom. inval.)]
MKVRCTCGCGQMVSRATHKRHLDGGGPTQVRINAAQRAINYTSRLVDRFKKKHPRERSATPESDAPPRKVARTAASTPASLPGTPMDIDDFGGLHTSFTPAMDRTPQEEPPIAENLDFLPTTRPRVLRTASEDSEGSAGSDPAPDIPNLTFTDPNVPDLDAELDEAALEHCELSAADILSGNILSQDAQSGPRLSERAMDSVRAHNFKVKTDLGSRAYNMMRRAFPQLKDLPSLTKLQSEVAFISGVKPVKYDCCVKSCCCFVGPYAKLDACPYCDEARRDRRGRPRATFEYLPLIPRLKALFADPDMCEKLMYRARYETEDGKIRDIFDSFEYERLRKEHGPNGHLPCRECNIEGIRDVAGGGNTQYVPAHRPGGHSYDPGDLPLRTHDEFIDNAVAVDAAATDADAKRLAKDTGINGLPILATLSSLSFPASFGHDLMHLIPENLVKNLLDLWSGEFKNLDTGKEDYELTEATREAIGRDCALAGDTTPAAFGARVPNLHTQRHYFTAESYTLWTTLLGPVLLHGRFQRPKYYNHFLDLVSIFNDCLALSIDREYVDTTLRQNIIDWVKKYERYYYQHNVSRLRACPLTVHALLHIADNILNAGPMWTYWNYITERFVGYLVRSSKSRKNPYASFARRLREIAQNSAIKVRYHAGGLREELDLSNRREEDTIGHSVASYPGIRVLYPRAEGPLERGALKAARNHLVRTYQLTEAEARDCVPENVVHWGKISFLNGGDKMRASELVQHSEHNLTRDASFIKYSHSVDKNQRFRNRPVDEERQVSYGQLLRIIEFKVRFPRDIRPRDRSLLLALVRPVRCAAKSDRLGFWYYQDGQFLPMEVIDVDDISCLVARIPGHKPGPQLWALCERQDAMAASDDVE